MRVSDSLSAVCPEMPFVALHSSPTMEYTDRKSWMSNDIPDKISANIRGVNTRIYGDYEPAPGRKSSAAFTLSMLRPGLGDSRFVSNSEIINHQPCMTGNLLSSRLNVIVNRHIACKNSDLSPRNNNNKPPTLLGDGFQPWLRCYSEI